MNILEVKNLNKSYDKFQLKDISFNLPYGRIMGVVGENGAGKSTLIEAILNIIRKDSGEVRFFGEVMEDKDTLIRDRIGVVFDDIKFHETFTPKQIGRILKSAYTSWSDEIYYSQLENFGLDENKTIKEFSKGMKMKLSLSYVLAQQPALLILDEPTSGIDPISREEMLDIFLDFIQDDKHSILFSSHITSDLEKIADYITFIHKGELILSEEKDELVYGYGLVRCGEETFNKINNRDYVNYKKHDYNYELLVEDRKSFLELYSNLDNLIVENPSIDDIMLLLAKGDKNE